MVSQLEESGFEVLLDRNRLQGGDQLEESIIQQWLQICDAAIILFSSHALKSDWVKVEYTNLSWRKSFNSQFLLIPILLPSVKRSSLEEGIFGIIRANNILQVEGEEVETITGKVIRILEPLKNPVSDEIEQEIAFCLEDCYEVTLEAAAIAIEEDLRWNPSFSKQQQLARCLREASSDSVVTAMERLSCDLKR
jgi:hypothetical protein